MFKSSYSFRMILNEHWDFQRKRLEILRPQQLLKKKRGNWARSHLDVSSFADGVTVPSFGPRRGDCTKPRRRGLPASARRLHAYCGGSSWHDQFGLHASVANLLVASSSACSLSMRDFASAVLCASRSVFASNSSRPACGKVSSAIVSLHHILTLSTCSLFCAFLKRSGLLNNFIRPQLFKNWIPFGQWRRRLVLRECGEAHDQHPPRDK